MDDAKGGSCVCPPDGGEGTSSAGHAIQQHSPGREERDATVPLEDPVPEPMCEAQPGDDMMAGKTPMGASPMPPGFGSVPRVWRVIRQSDE